MSETRIELISPGLRKRFGAASEAQLRRVAVVVCRAAIERAGLSHPVITQALALLEAGQLPTEDVRVEVQAYADQIDSAYLDLSDAGRATPAEVSAAFSRARAASAVAFALQEDALLAASEATYEAASVVDDTTTITAIAEMALSQDSAANP